MSKNKLHVCTYSTKKYTLRFVNLFVEVSRVCGVARAYPMTNGGNTFDMQDWDACLQGRSNVRKSEGEGESINSIKAVSLNKFYVF